MSLRNLPQIVPTILINSVSTGLVHGGIISVNASNPTKVDITRGFGYIVNNHQDPENPDIIRVEWPLTQGISIGSIATSDTTSFVVDRNGTFVQLPLSVASDPELFRDYIYLGSVSHFPNTIIGIANFPLGGTCINNSANFWDLSLVLQGINFTGNVFGPGGSGMTLGVTAGSAFLGSISYQANKKNPNIMHFPGMNPAPFIYTWRDGLGGFTYSGFTPMTNVTTNRFDNNTPVTGVTPNGTVTSNRWQIQRIYLSISGIFIHYGQNTYQNEMEATSGIMLEQFTLNPVLNLALFRGWLLVKGSASNLSNPSQAIFIPANRFGNIRG